MSRPHTLPTRRFKPQLAGPFISSMCFYLLSSSPHQQYLLQPDTVRLIPIKPDAPGCHIKTKYQQIPGAHFGTPLPGDTLTLHRDLTRVLLCSEDSLLSGSCTVCRPQRESVSFPGLYYSRMFPGGRIKENGSRITQMCRMNHPHQEFLTLWAV